MQALEDGPQAGAFLIPEPRLVSRLVPGLGLRIGPREPAPGSTTVPGQRHADAASPARFYQAENRSTARQVREPFAGD